VCVVDVDYSTEPGRCTHAGSCWRGRVSHSYPLTLTVCLFVSEPATCILLVDQAVWLSLSLNVCWLVLVKAVTCVVMSRVSLCDVLVPPSNDQSKSVHLYTVYAQFLVIVMCGCGHSIELNMDLPQAQSTAIGSASQASQQQVCNTWAANVCK